jgi:hypothetical protein
MLPFLRFVTATVERLKQSSVVNAAMDILLIAYCLALAVFVVRQVQKLRNGVPLNSPKLLLFAAVVPLQWLAFGYAAKFGFTGIIRAGIVAGLFHSFQYHRLMWFHNHNRYSEPESESRFGLAAALARHFAVYAMAALLLNLFLNVAPSMLLANSPLGSAVWGLAFTHYCLDARIWRVRGDRELAAALRL